MTSQQLPDIAPPPKKSKKSEESLNEYSDSILVNQTASRLSSTLPTENILSAATSVQKVPSEGDTGDSGKTQGMSPDAKKLLMDNELGDLIALLTKKGCTSTRTLAGLQWADLGGALESFRVKLFDRMVLAAQLTVYNLIQLQGMLEDFGVFSLAGLVSLDVSKVEWREAFDGLNGKEKIRFQSMLRDVSSSAGPTALPTSQATTFVVPPFPVDFDLSDAMLLRTPIPSPVPVLGYEGYQSREMDFNHFDSRFTHLIPLWMNGNLGVGEAGLISRNDALYAMYAYLANLSKFSRQRNQDSTTNFIRFDRTDYYGGVPLVLCEENFNNLEDAAADIRRKARWLPHYELLPFIFCIAATVDELEVFKLLPSLELVSLFKANLTNVVGRWNCVVAAINIARTLKLFIEQRRVITSLRFDEWHERNFKSIRLEAQFVEVRFNEPATYQRMVSFYDATNSVPNLEHFFNGNLPAYSPERSIIRLIPVGVTRKPRDADELLIAIRQILRCVFCLHDLGYVHCDIHWSNIISYLGDWYLIDCEHTCRLEEAAPLRERSQLIRRAFVLGVNNPWDQRFDLYQVGLLIQDCPVSNINPSLVTLRDLLVGKGFTVDTVRNAAQILWVAV